MMMKTIFKDKLQVNIYDNRVLLGADAAAIISSKIHELMKRQALVSIIFASAPSQNDFLAALITKPIDWGRVVAFHMDEYIGLEKEAPQGFGVFLRDRLFSKVPIGQAHYMDGNAADPQAECDRYAALLARYPPDIVCLGIGENTHLAFNDPHVADFKDPAVVKVVDLDADCRTQQVNDGCFATLGDVPTHAITITIPALFNVPNAYAIVPTALKADAIFHTLNSEIAERYPSTILRRHPNAVLFVDKDSASRIVR